MRELRTKRPENNRPKMSNADRAKQFAPFAALGHMGKEFAYIERELNIGELEHVAEWQDASYDAVADTE